MNIPPSKITSEQVTIFSEMSALASKYDAINLGQGFPDYDPPDTLIEIIKKHLADHKNQYAPMPGIVKLLEAISEKLYHSYQNHVHPESEITVTAGATQAIFTAINAFVHKGDEVIIFEPAYDCYRPSIEIAGGKAVIYTMNAPDFSINWKMVKALITSKTRMIIINTPHNPTGSVLNEFDLLCLSDAVKETDIIILSDEVYEHLIFDGKPHQSVIKYKELFSRSLCVYSFGKTFHATGWKIGYIVGPAYLMKEFRKIHQWNVFSVNSFLQYALAEHLQDKSNYEYLPDFYQQKRDYFLKILSKTAFRPLPCSGTYFQVVDFSAISNLDDYSFAREMTIKYKVAAIPLSPFYSTKTESRLIRFCFAKTQGMLDAAGEKLTRIDR
ncbi:MAG: aminotransferase class I/II-fold pyridoxal phosphate-dependent enzyme [Saprospiraceae bacterium]|nr:aminotransferase class I/II-fold pyridoxal phosphate-dependent enzyme [Saprospiraceae bacterium]